jgi:hypothetical protein
MVSRQREWQKAHPEQTRAQQTVQIAVKTGELIAQPCEFCGTTERIHAHHADYSMPLTVNWLCHSCHIRYHADKRAEIAAAAMALLPPPPLPITHVTPEFTCMHCGHHWLAKREHPVVCPRCKSYSYDQPYIRPRKCRQGAPEAQGRPNGV